MRQVFTEKELNALLDMISIRELSAPVREAIKLRVVHGYTLAAAAALSEVSVATVCNALKRITELEKKVVRYNELRANTSDC